jgi:hypothetical protein
VECILAYLFLKSLDLTSMQVPDPAHKAIVDATLDMEIGFLTSKAALYTP